jgi:amidohydrolase
MAFDLDRKKQEAFDRIDTLRDSLEDLARRIHSNPEVLFEERQAAAWLCEMLEQHGFSIERPIAEMETAFRAERGGPADGPAVAFFAEYDALPQLGHACGHNLIAAIAAGAALGTVAALPEDGGRVQVIGTPAEEGGGGKCILADAGVFDDVAAAMMVHPAGRNILWRKSLARRKLDVEFFGKPAHASANPEKGINALDAILLTFSGINALRQHMADDARIHGIVADGGVSPNVIPDYTRAALYVRALEDDYCDRLLERVKACAEGAAMATGCRVALDMSGSYKPLITNMALARVFRDNFEALGGTFEDIDPYKNLGSTDMGDASHRTPAIHPYLSISADGGELVGHSREFAEAACSERGMETMITAAKVLAASGLEVLLRPELREEIRREFAGA